MNLRPPICLHIAAAIVLFAASASAEEKKECILTTTLSRDQKVQINFDVSRERLSRQPDWVPSNNPIPLQPQQAVQTALQWYRARYHIAADSITVAGVNLQIVSLKNPYKWFYIISFRVGEAASKKLPNEHIWFAVVLLDGTVVVPHRKQGKPEYFSI